MFKNECRKANQKQCSRNGPKKPSPKKQCSGNGPKWEAKWEATGPREVKWEAKWKAKCFSGAAATKFGNEFRHEFGHEFGDGFWSGSFRGQMIYKCDTVVKNKIRDQNRMFLVVCLESVFQEFLTKFVPTFFSGTFLGLGTIFDRECFVNKWVKSVIPLSQIKFVRTMFPVTIFSVPRSEPASVSEFVSRFVRSKMVQKCDTVVKHKVRDHHVLRSRKNWSVPGSEPASVSVFWSRICSKAIGSGIENLSDYIARVNVGQPNEN